MDQDTGEWRAPKNPPGGLAGYEIRAALNDHGYYYYDDQYFQSIQVFDNPDTLTATDNKNRIIRVTWSAVTGAASYQLFRAETLDGNKSMIFEGNQTAFSDSDGQVAQTYFYWAKACNSYGCTGFSGYDTGYRPIADPSGIQASDGGSDTFIQTSWNAVSGATSYRLYRATESDGAKTTIFDDNATAFQDTTAEAGITYYYWVKACDAVACSAFSDYDTGYLAQPARKRHDAADDYAFVELRGFARRLRTVSQSSEANAATNLYAVEEYFCAVPE